MIRNYGEFLEQRWHEQDMPTKINSIADSEDAQRPLQAGWLLDVVSELRHTSMFEGRTHPDVGVLFKNWGNYYSDPLSGMDIATDIVCVRDSDDAGQVADPNVFAIVDGIVSVNSRLAHPGWNNNGLATGADIARWRDAPLPEIPVPDEPGPDPIPVPPAPPATDERTIVILTDIQTRLAAIGVAQDKQTAILEGLRRDINNGAKLLAQLLAGGTIGDLFKATRDGSRRPARLELSSVMAHDTAKLFKLPEQFDRQWDQRLTREDWRERLRQLKRGTGNGEAQDRKT